MIIYQGFIKLIMESSTGNIQRGYDQTHISCEAKYVVCTLDTFRCGMKECILNICNGGWWRT
jgi:hypothetical protein